MPPWVASALDRGSCAQKSGAMDPGTAAVLGALAGSVATIGAAYATSWSQREGARIAARSEHRRQRLEPRHSVYKEFIAEASRIRDQTGMFSTVDMFPSHLVTEELAQRIEECADTVREKWVEVALAGPKEVSEAASRIERLSNALAFRVQGYRRLVNWDGDSEQGDYTAIQERIGREAIELEESLDRLIFAAQTALDDDGSMR